MARKNAYASACGRGEGEARAFRPMHSLASAQAHGAPPGRERGAAQALTTGDPVRVTTRVVPCVAPLIDAHLVLVGGLARGARVLQLLGVLEGGLWRWA